ncbi:hypothetical protein BU15DRAFT_56372, partial [Melanogaster broomeanus]
YSTTYNTLRKFGEWNAKVTAALGSDLHRWPILRLDNVQSFLRQRDPRMGRVDHIKLGTAGTVVEAVDFNPAAADLDDKRAQLAKGRRKDLTVWSLLALIDHSHLATVMSLHWLKVLVSYVPELAVYKEEVIKLFRTKAAIQRIPLHKSKIHPLSTNAFNEAQTTELKDSLLDFLTQMGITKDSHLRRLILVGGDGLTYEKIVQLKRYLQFHDDVFESMELLEPILELWHTEWANLSRVCETHWGDGLSNDPSTLGHSATQIGRKPPPNLKKVDYYPACHLVDTVLDARMLDCWRLVELKASAEEIHLKYSNAKSYERVVVNVQVDLDIPYGLGETWEPPATQNSSVTADKLEASDEDGKPFEGDHTLAYSMIFIRDALIYREMAYAVCDGDIGRAYECIKTMIFSFTGSKHTKYATYLLEMICNLELESGEALRDAIKSNWLVNPEGLAGKFHGADLMQEHLNLDLDESRDHNDAEWDGAYMREVVSPNINELRRIKKDLLSGLHLSKKGGKHAEPHNNPELKTLLQVYKEQGLHLFRKGRTYGERQVDDFKSGFEKLLNGKLQKFIRDTTTSRGLVQELEGLLIASDDSSINGLDDEDSDVDEEPETLDNVPLQHSNGMRYLEDGHMVVEIDEGSVEASSDCEDDAAMEDGSEDEIDQ